MEDHTRILSPNTVIFAQLKPEVALVIVDIVAAITSVLRWRQVSQNLLFAILTRIGECDFFDCSHANFSAAIWSYLNGSAREDKFSKWLTKLKEDMALSKFFPVDVKKPRPDRHEDGSFRSRPTRYLPGVFWNLYYVVQDEALKCDLFSFEKDERRAWIRAIVKRWLGEHGALAIERVKKDDKVKPPNPSLPCSCACVGCQDCSAKASVSSTLPSSEPVLSVQIEQEKKRLREIEEEFVVIGQARLNRGDKLSVVDNKINAVATAARMRLKAARGRKDGYGDDYASNTGARARGRASQEVAVAELREMKRVAEEMGEFKHAAKLAEFASVLEAWKLFSNRSGVVLNGGQPK